MAGTAIRSHSASRDDFHCFCFYNSFDITFSSVRRDCLHPPLLPWQFPIRICWSATHNRASPLLLFPGAFLLRWSQITPASSLWRQLCVPMSCLMQSAKDLSLPVHFTLSTWIGPLPSPKYAIVLALAGPLETKYIFFFIKHFEALFYILLNWNISRESSERNWGFIPSPVTDSLDDNFSSVASSTHSGK